MLHIAAPCPSAFLAVVKEPALVEKAGHTTAELLLAAGVLQGSFDEK